MAWLNTNSCCGVWAGGVREPGAAGWDGGMVFVVATGVDDVAEGDGLVVAVEQMDAAAAEPYHYLREYMAASV